MSLKILHYIHVTILSEAEEMEVGNSLENLDYGIYDLLDEAGKDEPRLIILCESFQTFPFPDACGKDLVTKCGLEKNHKGECGPGRKFNSEEVVGMRHGNDDARMRGWVQYIPERKQV
jgi:hypothetical protein